MNPGANVSITGGPAWIELERYSISARVEGGASQGMMRGPMMQAVLEDRFQLKIRRDTREVPVYSLTVAQGGAKLPRFQEGSCNPIDFTLFPPVVPENPCPSLGSSEGPNVTVNTQGRTVSEFARIFLARLNRPVIDNTGLTGKFNFHLVYAPEDADGAAADLFTALQQQLGLKLEKARGPGEGLVIDRVERPAEN